MAEGYMAESAFATKGLPSSMGNDAIVLVAPFCGLQHPTYR